MKVLEVAQPLGTFYVGVMKANDLRNIAAADTRCQEQREVEIYTGIQRELSKKRQAEIKEYISTFDAAFPNSFIIAIKAVDVLSQDGGTLKIRAHEKAASIIDCQHRLAGFGLLEAPCSIHLRRVPRKRRGPKQALPSSRGKSLTSI